MAYPKNDTDWREFTIKTVHNTSEYWEIFSTDGQDSQSFHMHFANFTPKVGMRYRVYGWEGSGRGLYVAGRILKPYRTRAQQRENNLKFFKSYVRRAIILSGLK